MPILETELNVNSDEFKANQIHMQGLVNEFRAIEDTIKATEEKARPKFEKRGQLLPRERIEHLLDTGSPFMELMSLAGYQMHDDKDGSTAGGGLIAGMGYVAGARCLVVANNSAIKG